MGQERCLGIRDHTQSADTSADRSLLPFRNTPLTSPQQLLGRKRNHAPCSSDSIVTHEPESSLHTKKGGTQAGCKRFESFMRRGIFPVNFFFSFLKFVSKEREQKRSHEF